MLKKLLACGIICFALSTANAQNLKTPQPSPTQTIKQDFGISSAELIYSRPGIKGRKIFGDLVPFGKVWRTGANQATRLKFTDDVTIGGQALKAGEYAVYTIPNEKEWDVIINKGSANWGAEYIEYLQYTNRVLLEMIDDILSKAVKPPVIILTSDHGFREFPKAVDPKYYFMNLLSVYLPHQNYTSFYEGMSNVNLFRILFNQQFHQQFALLKDSTILIRP